MTAVQQLFVLSVARGEVPGLSREGVTLVCAVAQLRL